MNAARVAANSRHLRVWASSAQGPSCFRLSRAAMIVVLSATNVASASALFRERTETGLNPDMRESPLPRNHPASIRAAIGSALCIALAAALVLGAAWAKASRYSENASPSPHFSASVKIVRGLFHAVPGDDSQALIAAAAQIPEPDWSGLAPVHAPALSPGNPPLPARAFRGPPVLA